MHAKTQTLARRLLGHYLMFGLMSIVVLCVAWALLGRTILSNVKDHEYINRIDEVRALLVTDFVENGGSGSKTFIQLLSMDDWVAYAGIIGRDGKYLAHSNPGRVGKTSDSHFQHRGVGLIERQIVRSKGQQKSEYWAPLEANGKDFGSLQVGVVQETSETWLKRLLDWIPYAILAPVLILGIGTIFLKRAARTSADRKSVV